MMEGLLLGYIGKGMSWSDATKAAPGWMQKVHVVGDEETVKAFVEAHDVMITKEAPNYRIEPTD